MQGSSLESSQFCNTYTGLLCRLRLGFTNAVPDVSPHSAKPRSPGPIEGFVEWAPGVYRCYTPQYLVNFTEQRLKFHRGSVDRWADILGLGAGIRSIPSVVRGTMSTTPHAGKCIPF